MPMTPQNAAQRITRNLLATENDLDRVLASSASLLADIVQARIDVGADAASGQIAIMRVTEALGALSTARKQIVQTHSELRKVGEERADIVFPSECPKSAAEQDDRDLKAA
jgi:hypothetical protein